MKSKLTTIICALGAFFVLNACKGSKKVQCESYSLTQTVQQQDLASK